MRLLDVIQRSTAYLETHGVESPRLQIESILAHVLRIPRLQLYLRFEQPLDEVTLETVRALVRRRGQREPLQHLLGTAAFCGLDMAVSADVLVPRPETELLAEQAWTWAQRRARETTGAVRILDWGTGSGCLAIAIAVHAPDTRITALDVSASALDVARANARRHGVGDRIEFVEGDGVDALPQDVTFDLAVSNPPYIPTADIATLQPEVRDHDPHVALDGGVDGLDVYRRLAGELQARLRDGGVLLIEFGDDQGSPIAALLKAAGWVVDAAQRDYSGRDRFLMARRSGPAN